MARQRNQALWDHGLEGIGEVGEVGPGGDLPPLVTLRADPAHDKAPAAVRSSSLGEAAPKEVLQCRPAVLAGAVDRRGHTSAYTYRVADPEIFAKFRHLPVSLPEPLACL
jgi:hypothetical protein